MCYHFVYSFVQYSMLCLWFWLTYINIIECTSNETWNKPNDKCTLTSPMNGNFFAFWQTWYIWIIIVIRNCYCILSSKNEIGESKKLFIIWVRLRDIERERWYNFVRIRMQFLIKCSGTIWRYNSNNCTKFIILFSFIYLYAYNMHIWNFFMQCNFKRRNCKEKFIYNTHCRVQMQRNLYC